MPNFKITIVVDNRSQQSELPTEHGFSAWIEGSGPPVLFDSGKGGVLFPNLHTLGLAPEILGAVVLSHGHHDHAGGLPQLLHHHPHLMLHATPNAFLPKWSLDPDQQWRYAGIPRALHDLCPVRCKFHESPAELEPGLWVTGPLWPSELGLGAVADKRLHINYGDKCVADRFTDEQAIVFDHGKSLSILVACCHQGIPALLESVVQKFPHRTIHTLLGGFHLAGQGPAQWDKAILAIQEHKIQRLVSLHCSGDDWMEYALAKMPGIAQNGYTGQELVIS